MNRIFLLSAVLLINFFPVHGQVSDFIKDSLDTYVERALMEWDIPGAAVCVVKDGQIIVSKGYGVKKLGKIEKVDANTLFLIGSNTKAFTGTLMSLLENEGRLSLQDKVQKYLPDFRMKDPWVGANLNLTDILCHRMGLESFQGDFMYWTSDLTAEEVIQKFGKLTPAYDFRTKYGYTNAGFAIAGEVIKVVTDTSWSDFVKARIFEPLKMERTIPLSKDFAASENIAAPHTFIDFKIAAIPFQNIDNLAPAGSIGSSVNDMSHWLIAQLDSGKYNGKSVIPFTVIQKTRAPRSIIGRTNRRFNNTHYSLYGLGWQLEDYEGLEIVSHTGAVNGFVTSVTLIPEENIGIVVLTNTDMNLFYQALKWELIDALLGLEYRNYDNFALNIFNTTIDNEKSILTAQRDTINMHLIPALNLSEFRGNYENQVYGLIEIVQKENYLEMKFQHHSKLHGKLEPLGGSRFLCTYNDPAYGTAVIPFNINNNKVESLTLKVNDFVEYSTYEFVKEKQ